MDLGSLKHAEGATRKTKRIGRGPGSGHGKTATRGHKGQHARSGAKHRAWFEGGQMPLQRRVPKRGFTHIFKKTFEIVNVGDLERIQAARITAEQLLEANLIPRRGARIKILGEGEIKKAVEIEAHAFSKSAEEKIQAAGGKAIRI
ncbi:MAG TPA: 50S ribosomal protein L15 [bacterium]|nr:50S ribosomal protein L15 [bacterium]